jgi:hypothetical protein
LVAGSAEDSYAVGRNVWSLWKSMWSLLKNLKMKLLYDPAIAFLGIYLKESESAYKR